VALPQERQRRNIFSSVTDYKFINIPIYGIEIGRVVASKRVSSLGQQTRVDPPA
jgi:hypothetical protein